MNAFAEGHTNSVGADGLNPSFDSLRGVPIDVSRQCPHVVGSVVKGRVVAHIDRGALIDLGGGFKGVLSPKEVLLFNKSSTLAEVLPLGADVSVVVHRIKIRDAMRHNIDLKRERVHDSRWDEFEGDYPVGTRVQAKVYDLKDYGAMIELPYGLTALVHNSEISWTDTKAKANKIFSKGQIIDISILQIEKEKCRISASFRECFENPYSKLLETYPLETSTIGTVDNVQRYGVFVKLDNGCIGLLHNSQLPQGNSTFNEGDKLNVRIIAYDRETLKFKLGISAD